jgi:hypothetical protein
MGRHEEGRRRSPAYLDACVLSAQIASKLGEHIPQDVQRVIHNVSIVLQTRRGTDGCTAMPAAH